MGHEFEVVAEAITTASPDQVWEAIASSSGMDGWFMGDNTVEPRLGGSVETRLPGFSMRSTISTFEPPLRFVTQSSPGEDGRWDAFSFEIEGRAGHTRIRLVHSGFFPQDDWETEYDALQNGDPAYLAKLVEYVERFRGRQAVPITAWGPQVSRDVAWAAYTKALGVGPDPKVGDPVHFRAAGIPDLDGEVDYVTRDFLGFRTADGMYRFIHGLGTVAIGHHIYVPVDRPSVENAWQAWIDSTFGPAAAAE
jgi:uncharacterized protein YndB with AHSA1/START domain